MTISKNIIVFLCFVLAVSQFSYCKKNTATTAGKTVPSKKMVDAYTEVQYGNMPLVISVPHGGALAPAAIPDRNCAGITTVTDNNTIELLNAIDSVSRADYSLQPYYVLTYLKRIKIDQNRDFVEATCNNSGLYSYWSNYHQSIDTCLQLIRAKYPECLFIDLHGHGHTKQRLELGYLVDGASLRNPASIVSSTTSLYNLLQQNTSLSISQLLTATNAFGTMMGNRGFLSVPSSQVVSPDAGDPFFDGGYNTARYTNTTFPKVWGWQIESNYTGVRDSPASFATFAKAFMQSVMQFYTVNSSMSVSSFGK